METRFRSDREELEIEAERLQPNAQYTIIIDGFVLGTVTTDNNGKFDLKWSTESGNLPSQLRPVTNIQSVEIVNGSGVVLSGGPPS